MALQFNIQAVVQGVAKFDGVIDGKQLNSGTLFILEELDDKAGNAKGQRTTENKCVNADVVKRIMHLGFPGTFNLVYERQVTKGGERLIIVDAKPIELRKAA